MSIEKFDRNEIEKLFVEYHYYQNLDQVLSYVKTKKLYVDSPNDFFTTSYRDTVEQIGRILPPLASISIVLSLSKILTSEITNLGIIESISIANKTFTRVHGGVLRGQKYMIDIHSKKTVILVEDKKTPKIALSDDLITIKEQPLGYAGIKLRLVLINTDSFEIINPQINLAKAIKRTYELFSSLAMNVLDVAREHVCNLYGKYKCPIDNKIGNIDDLLVKCQLHCLSPESPTHFFVNSYLELLGFLGALKRLTDILTKA